MKSEPISRNIVTLMGGTLNVKSEVGSGSEFYFTIVLPFGKPVEARVQKASLEAFVNARFLLAEDNPLNAEIATDLFTAEDRSDAVLVAGALNGKI